MTETVFATTIIGMIGRGILIAIALLCMMAATALVRRLRCAIARKCPHAPEWTDQEG
jgi:hypothetical protein